MALWSKLKKTLARLLRSTHPKSVNVFNSSAYYPQSQSCQIPNLDFLYNQVFGRTKEGVFVEIGGFDGYTASNTWGLAAKGWSGTYVEPVPAFAEKCRQNHAAHPNVVVSERAISKPGVSRLTIDLASALSTANKDLLEEYGQTNWAREALTGRQVECEASTLDNLLNSRNILPGFDLLVVDVEGLEFEVFEGFSLAEWKPTAMIVELADTHPDLTVTRSSDYAVAKKILSEGYVIIYKDHINTFFVLEELWGLSFAPV